MSWHCLQRPSLSCLGGIAKRVQCIVFCSLYVWVVLRRFRIWLNLYSCIVVFLYVEIKCLLLVSFTLCSYIHHSGQLWRLSFLRFVRFWLTCIHLYLCVDVSKKIKLCLEIHHAGQFWYVKILSWDVSGLYSLVCVFIYVSNAGN